MTFDLNNAEQLESLAKAARSDDGQIILGFLSDKLEEMKKKRDDINLESDDSLVGQEFKKWQTAIKELENIIKFLYSRYEQ